MKPIDVSKSEFTLNHNSHTIRSKHYFTNNSNLYVTNFQRLSKSCDIGIVLLPSPQGTLHGWSFSARQFKLVYNAVMNRRPIIYAYLSVPAPVLMKQSPT
jgi:hypothetical protein